MVPSNDILKKTSAYVLELFTQKLPPWAVYHNYDHSLEIVEAAREIGEGSRLTRGDLEIAQLAAWMHDVGYTETFDGHEEAGAAIARNFLESQNYPAEKIDQVVSAILATKMPQQPKNLIEQVVCDADIIHVGKKRFFERSELLRLEIERRTGKVLSEAEWLGMNIDFVTNHPFFTPYARVEFANRRTKTLSMLQEQVRDLTRQKEGENARWELKREKIQSKMEKEKVPERGIETMFRTVPANHLSLSAMADNKANLMISTNSIIISIVFGLLVSKLDTNPHLILPTMILLIVCLTAMIFAILVTRPTVSTGIFTREDIEKKRANLLFFGNFHSMPLQDFEWGMKEMMKDKEYLYESMIRDLFFLGKVLGRKYRYLRICYNVFMYGLIVAVIAFVFAFLNAPPAV